MLVTTVSHAQLVAEVRSRRAVWDLREPELGAASGSLPEHPPVKADRVTPFPAGPVEVFTDRVAAASLVAAGALFAATRDLARAASLLLVGVPPAARLGREAFAATLARHLAGMGVVPMDPGAFRRLDRISAILIDDQLLRGVLAGHGTWLSATAAHLVGDPIQPDLLQPPATAGMVLFPAGIPGVSSGVEPLPAGETILDAVGRLQAAGHGVLLLAGSDNNALAAADVAIAIDHPDQPVGWAADLLCRPQPAPVITLLNAVPAARRVSRRSVTIAAVGSAAATALTTLSPLPYTDLTMQPVYLSGLLAQWQAAQSASTLARNAAHHPAS